MTEKIEVIADLKDLISRKFADIEAKADQLDSKISGIGGTGGIGGKGIMGSVLGANLLTQAITAGVGAVKQFGIESFYAYGRAEQFQTSLTTMLHGNAGVADALNNQLKQFAIETPFELTEIQEGTKMMIAYGSQAGDVVEEMRMLGDISAGVGSSLSEVAYLYGTLRTQGRAFSKDIYQFTGRGIPIIKELAKQFGVADSEVMKLVEDGKVGFKEVEKAMRSLTDEGGQFHNMMAAQSKTLLGQVSNLSDAWEQLQVSIGESQQGILKGTVKFATDMVNALRQSVDLKNFQTKALGAIRGSVGYNALSPFPDDDKDKRHVVEMKSGERREFSDSGEYERFRSQNMAEIKTARTLSSRYMFDDFSERILEKVQALKPEDVQNMLNEITALKRDIMSQTKAGTMSRRLAINELAVLSQATKDVMNIKKLDETKTDDGAKEPKKLEEVAKKNKAVQVIVNIENLVREYTNEMISPDQAKQMTTHDVAKALISAVNDIYSVGL